MPEQLRKLLPILLGIGSLGLVLAVLLGAAQTEAASAYLQAEATVDACAPPTLTPINEIVNVRAGPGPGFRRLGRLEEGEERPVIGHHRWYDWWQIELSDSEMGWVWDSVVEIRGNISAVPIVTLAADDGTEPPESGLVAWVPPERGTCAVQMLTHTGAILTTPTPVPGATGEGLNANDDGWLPPINLSRSGLAGEPQVVVDSWGTPHVLWQEQGVDGFLYARETADGWAVPLVVEFPFGTRAYMPELTAESATPLFTPVLVADGAGTIHALWLDGEGALQHSDVAAGRFGSFEAWSVPVTVTESALGAAATTDAGGRLHVSYIRPTESAGMPAGVYYQQATDGGGRWTAPAPLYNSGYLRAVTAENARVQIATSGRGDAARVYVAWDNPALEQVFLARSTTGGSSWMTPTLIDGRQPQDRSDGVGAGNVHLAANGDNLLVLWQAGHENTTCQQYYRYSDDGGKSWVASGILFEDFASCPVRQQLLPAASGSVLLLATVEQQPYLLAWDGAQWSEPQYQELLAQFTNPETFRDVSYIAHRATTSGQRLVLVGAGAGNGQDVWATERGAGETETWYPPPPVWSELQIVAEAALPLKGLAVVAGGGETVHAFWSEAGGTAIAYAVWNGQNWSRAVPLFEGETAVEALSVAAEGNGRLLLAWSRSDGVLWFSQAQAERATIGSEWSEPARLPAASGAYASQPALAVDEQAGSVYVVYTIPLNEARGIYLTASKDGGESWDEARTVFDAERAGWERVGDPQLGVAGKGDLHVIFEKGSLGESGPVALHYAHSTDGGATWSEPETMENGMPQTGTVVWSDLVVTAGRLVHVAWQEDGERLNLWHKSSTDNGMTWSRAARIGGFGEEFGRATLARDGAGRVYLLALAKSNPAIDDKRMGETALQQWLWQAEEARWEQIERVEIGTGTVRGQSNGVEMALAGAITSEGMMAAVVTAAGSETDEGALLSTQREIALPAILPTPLPTLTPTPQPTVTPAPTREPEPTATPIFAKGASDRPVNLNFLPVPGANTVVLGVILALVPALLLTALALVVYNRIRLRQR